MESPDNFKIEEYEIKRLMANPNFIKSAVELRQKLGIEPEGFTTNKEQNAWNERQSKKDKERFDLAVHHLITDFELSARWRDGLKLYILTNNPHFLRVQSSYGIRFEFIEGLNNPKNILAAWIKVDADTTQREILEAFKEAKKRLPKKRKKQLPININRDLKVLELHNRGWSNSKIARWLNDREPTTFNSDQLAKIILRTKEKLL